MLNICVKHKKIIKNKAIHVIIHTGVTQLKCSKCEIDLNYIYTIVQRVISIFAHAGEKILRFAIGRLCLCDSHVKTRIWQTVLIGGDELLTVMWSRGQEH